MTNPSRPVSEPPRGPVRLPRALRQMGAKGEYKHRSGWPYVVSALAEAEGFADCLVDDYVERTFAIKPAPSGRSLRRLVKRAASVVGGTSAGWKEPWVGVFHNPPHFPAWYSPAAHPQAIFAGQAFQQSLPYLRGAVALSEYLAAWLRDELSVPAIAIKHPTETPPRRFDVAAFAESDRRRMVQVGWYLRNYRAIYQVAVPAWLQKVHLEQHGTAIQEARLRTDRHAPHRLRPDQGEVEVVSWLEDEAYDRLLTESIVFLELLDASANNAVIEAIVRETPIVVNRHPAVVEYLGPAYPLYYDSLDEVHDLLTMARIEAANRHLREMDKGDLTVEHFIDRLRTFVNGVCTG